MKLSFPPILYPLTLFCICNASLLQSNASLHYQSETASFEFKSQPMQYNPDRDKFTKTVNEGDRYDILLNWLLANGAKFPDLEMVSYSTNVRGVHAKRTIEKDEIICEIPLNLLFTVEMGMDLELGRKLLDARVDFEAPKHIYLMLFLLIDGEKEDSFFRPYYDTLPQVTPNFPIFWSEDELKWLEGSYLLHQIDDRKSSIKREYEKICDIDPDFRRFSLERFSWARMIVCSRNFGITVNSIQTSAMVPFADMLNHYRPRETAWCFDTPSGNFQITSLTELVQGHQVYDSYGKKCNHRFLLNYGFAIENNVEVDGRCANEIYARFTLPPSDPFKLRKNRLLMTGGYGEVIGIRITNYYYDTEPYNLFAYLRIILCDEKELFLLEENTQRQHISALEYAKQPLGLWSEIRVLKVLSELGKRRLQLYPTTLEEDLRLLNSTDLEPFSNHRHAVIMVKGEKVIFQTYIDLYEKVLEIMQLPPEDATELIYSKYIANDEISEYISRQTSTIITQFGTIQNNTDPIEYDYLNEVILY